MQLRYRLKNLFLVCAVLSAVSGAVGSKAATFEKINGIAECPEEWEKLLEKEKKMINLTKTTSSLKTKTETRRNMIY